MSAVEYIINFLLHNDKTLINKVGYTADSKAQKNFKVVIVPSAFFTELYMRPESLPSLPLQTVEGVPLLFGVPRTEWLGDTLLVHADIVASSYFLISRYEECLNPARDIHGRFTAALSLAGRAGFLQRPVVDEYGRLLRGWLRQAGVPATEPPRHLHSVCLTHDVDILTAFRRVRGTLGGLWRTMHGKEQLQHITKAWKNVACDPIFCFPWFVHHDSLLPQARQIYFVKAVHCGSKYDYPAYGLHSRDFRRFTSIVQQGGAEIGLHTSYAAGMQPQRIVDEKARLEAALGNAITTNRYHYLRTTTPHDMQALVDSGFTDDFTLGFAEQIGFRLGTTRAVHFINPYTRQLTALLLHPLTVMDVTLSNSNYMHLSEDMALDQCRQMIAQTVMHHGDIVLLWHNTSLIIDYHRTLYPKILVELSKEFFSTVDV